MELDLTRLKSKEQVLADMHAMNGFGTRLTGSEGQNAFVAFLKQRAEALGYQTYSDLYSFDRWEAQRSSITIHRIRGDEPVAVSSVWPYSGETGPLGVTGEAVEVFGKHINYLHARGKIALVTVSDLGRIPSGIAFNQRGAYPGGTNIPAFYKGPVATSFVNVPFLQVAKAAGVKAVICIWKGMSRGMVQGQYLPFIQDYQGIPALWVCEEEGEKLRAAARNGDKVTLVLEAKKEKNAASESFYCVKRGKNPTEAIIVNTHTDGVNCVEENGPIALLAMMEYLKDAELERSVIFVFVTGHFRLPAFKQNDIQATSKWLKNHRDLWDGRSGHIKAVAGLAVEHLGCREWKDVNGEYRETNPIDIEIVYTGNRVMDAIYYKALEGRTLVRTVTLRGHNILHFGEGQPLMNVGIPQIALVTAPDYLTAAADDHQMSRFSVDLMYEQIQTFLRALFLIDETDAKTLGKPDPYTFVFGSVGKN
ncbi:MAG: hypothetical protein IKH12_03825 [Clostridia bacterium]|nr:hypothetical protein [Clostridia bacterium]MBQ6092067.1 hypothetical protein [Clostridia bacterium]MBR3094700.1 hypothetical protein [Clostridia bacterium]